MPATRPLLHLTLTTLLIGVLLIGCGQAAVAPEPVTAPPPVGDAPVATTDVRRGDLVETIIVNGQLTPAREQALFFRQGGRLKNMTISSGDKVTTGQVLAELEVGGLATEATLAEIEMKKAQLKLEDARSKGANRFDLQQAQFDYDTGRLKYEQLRRQLEETRLVAPFDGIVAETQGRPGEAATAFLPVVKLSDPAKLQITATLANANDGARLAIGQPGSVLLDKLPSARLPLQVVQLPTTAPTLANGTPMPEAERRLFKLDATGELPKGLELGMIGRVTVTLRDKKGILLVKSTAVRTAGPRQYAQVIQQGRKREVDVEVGIITPTDTEIISGLREGERVVDGVAGVPTPVGGSGTPGTKPGGGGGGGGGGGQQKPSAATPASKP